MNAEPSCRRQEMAPVLYTARLAAVPRKMPEVVSDDLGFPTALLTECGPKLPGHHKCAADSSRGVLSSEDRGCRPFQTHSNSHKYPAYEELLPCLANSAADWGQDKEDSGDEDGTSSSKKVVQRIRKPASNERRCNVRSRINDADQPEILFGIGVGRAVFKFCRVRDTESDGERQICAVGTRLIPASVARKV